MEADNEKTGVIVVGVDGLQSLDALKWAARQAELTGATLEAVMAWMWPSYWGREAVGPPGVDPEEESRKMLAEVVGSALGDERSREVRQVVVESHPAKALLAAADRADLLVVGSRGHGAFAEMLLGSVSMHCVASARCPVVVVHPRSR
jgi:nucleotide-binding universal stress UspA family protein